MKSPSKRVVNKTAFERLDDWKNHECPYCGSFDVMVGVINNGKYRAICFACETENYFSGAILTGAHK